MKRKMFITRASIECSAQAQWVAKHGDLKPGTMKEMLKETKLEEKWNNCPVYGD